MDQLQKAGGPATSVGIDQNRARVRLFLMTSNVSCRSAVKATAVARSMIKAIRGGRPVLDDGRVLDVASVVWCTGYRHDYSWLDAPGTSTDEHGVPVHDRGVVAGTDGLYLVGLHFLYAMSSAMIHGVDRDAAHVAAHIARRASRRPAGRVVSPRSGPADEPARPAARRG